MDISINLLPPVRKEEVKNLRRIGIVLKIGFSAFCAITVFLVFSYFCIQMILIQERVLVDEMQRFEQDPSFKTTKAAQDTLRDYSEIAGKVKSGLNSQSSYWQIINEVNSLVPKEIVLKEFSIDEEGELTLKGLAYTREALLVLKEGLEKSGKINDVVSPISNFVAGKDVDFEFTAQVK